MEDLATSVCDVFFRSDGMASPRLTMELIQLSGVRAPNMMMVVVVMVVVMTSGELMEVMWVGAAAWGCVVVLKTLLFLDRLRLWGQSEPV